MTDTISTDAPKKSKRGFAGMSPEKRREIARKGGASVPSEKRSFAKSRDLASWAGRKGGSTERVTPPRTVTVPSYEDRQK